MTRQTLDFEAATRLPERIKFGTSSWNYSGWQDLVYVKKYSNDKDFKRSSLSEYVECPWFRTVGIDSSFYGPLKASTLSDYASRVPTGFRWVSKIWERLTIPRFPNLPRYGPDAGKDNPAFLDAELCKKTVLTPLEQPTIAPHVGPIVLQFPSISPSTLSFESFLARLDLFLAKLPTHFQYAAEIRNPEFLQAPYFSVLNAHGATHCFNHWHRMPTLKQQMQAAASAGGLSAKFFVARILTPLGVSYEGAVKLFQPYAEIRRPNAEMRADVARLAHRALERNVDAYILVNNRSEGCAPLTIDAIGKSIVATL